MFTIRFETTFLFLFSVSASLSFTMFLISWFPWDMTNKINRILVSNHYNRKTNERTLLSHRTNFSFNCVYCPHESECMNHKPVGKNRWFDFHCIFVLQLNEKVFLCNLCSIHIDFILSYFSLALRNLPIEVCMWHIPIQWREVLKTFFVCQIRFFHVTISNRIEVRTIKRNQTTIVCCEK